MQCAYRIKQTLLYNNLESTEPAYYVKQSTCYGEFCKNMLIDIYEEIKQEKFRNEKKFIETRYSALLSKTIAGRFSK